MFFLCSCLFFVLFLSCSAFTFPSAPPAGESVSFVGNSEGIQTFKYWGVKYCDITTLLYICVVIHHGSVRVNMSNWQRRTLCKICAQSGSGGVLFAVSSCNETNLGVWDRRTRRTHFVRKVALRPHVSCKRGKRGWLACIYGSSPGVSTPDIIFFFNNQGSFFPVCLCWRFSFVVFSFCSCFSHLVFDCSLSPVSVPHMDAVVQPSLCKYNKT